MINSKHKKKPPRGPKLVRRNAIKNIDYDASTSESTSASYSYNSSTSEDRSVYETRYTDLLPVSRRTSFRVRGNDGDCDQIFRYLGLSGPENVSIPVGAWEARKNLSRSANLKTSKFVDDTFEAKVRVSECERKDGVETVELSLEDGAIRVDEMKGDDTGSRMLLVTGDSRIEDIVTPKMEPSQSTKHSAVDSYEFEGDFGFRVAISNDEPEDGVESTIDGSGARADEVSEDGVKTESNNVGLRIRGIRPPKLAPPPLAIRTVMVDNTSSTWDLFRAFGPGDQDSSSLCDVISNSINEVREQEEADKTNINGTLRESNEVEGHESGVGLDWPSDSSAEGGENDSVALMSENDHTISPNGSFSCNIKSWQKGDFLGSGSFGTVYEGFTDDGLFFAVKEVSLLDEGSLGQQSIHQLEQEISLLSQFQHENIVRYLGTDKDDTKLYIFLELVTKGSLARLYQKYRLQDSQVSAYTRQILSGLNYLHCRNVVHRDIKCANILVDVTGSVKLADFGLAKATKLNDIKSCKGTPFWMAPEVVNQRKHGYGRAADIWSLGCSVLEMLTGQIPYSHLEGMQALFRIGRGELPPLPNTLSRDAHDFILDCLQVNPDDRPSAAQLLRHPFVKKPHSTFSSPVSPYYHAMRS